MRTADVVAVFVGDEDGVDVFGRRPAWARRRQVPDAESAIDQQAEGPPRASTTVALPALPLPRLLKRSTANASRLQAWRAYFRSSAITCTMRWALADVPGAPWALSTETVVRFALALDRDAVLQRRRFAPAPLNSLPKKPGSLLLASGST